MVFSQLFAVLVILFILLILLVLLILTVLLILIVLTILIHCFTTPFSRISGSARRRSRMDIFHRFHPLIHRLKLTENFSCNF